MLRQTVKLALLSWTGERALLIVAVVGGLVGCATQPPRPQATPETFEAVACEDLARLKYDREVRLLQLSANLQRARAATPTRGGSSGFERLGDSLANLGRRMRINEITDEITAVRVETAAIGFNLSDRCGQRSARSAEEETDVDAPTEPEGGRDSRSKRNPP